MSMSKKDFVALANVIRDQPQRWFDYIAGKCGPNGGAVKRS